MIELTPEQVEALHQESGSPTVIDPTTKTAYTLVPIEAHTNGGTNPVWESVETPVESWNHLVRRNHPWRRQLYIKGRNMTVRQLLSSLPASGFDEAEAAENLELPVEAIREALTYAEQNAALLDFETAYEHLRLAERGKRLGPQSVPG
jgi:uncharacterized protein (DUF433 family)